LLFPLASIIYNRSEERSGIILAGNLKEWFEPLPNIDSKCLSEIEKFGSRKL
jgi:hypothetical protein